MSYGLNRWRMNTLTLWNRKWIAGDYSNGKLYELDWAVQSENGEEMERRRTFPVAHDNQNKLGFNAIELLFDTGYESTATVGEWMNIFTLGACTLAVHKNESATAMTAGEMTTDGVTVSVNGVGLITLVTPANGALYEARVTPQYSVAGMDVRLSGVSITANFQPNPAAIWDGLTFPGSLVYVNPGVTPDPFPFQDGETWTRAGLSVNESIG